jgi:hypothetical protein
MAVEWRGERGGERHSGGVAQQQAEDGGGSEPVAHG